MVNKLVLDLEEVRLLRGLPENAFWQEVHAEVCLEELRQLRREIQGVIRNLNAEGLRELLRVDRCEHVNADNKPMPKVIDKAMAIPKAIPKAMPKAMPKTLDKPMAMPKAKPIAKVIPKTIDKAKGNRAKVRNSKRQM